MKLADHRPPDSLMGLHLSSYLHLLTPRRSLNAIIIIIIIIITSAPPLRIRRSVTPRAYGARSIVPANSGALSPSGASGAR